MSHCPSSARLHYKPSSGYPHSRYAGPGRTRISFIIWTCEKDLIQLLFESIYDPTPPGSAMTVLLLRSLLVMCVYGTVYGHGSHGSSHHNVQNPDEGQKQGDKHKKPTNFTDINKAHIEYHLKDIGVDPDTSKMDNTQLEFYHFKIHDVNNDLTIDGLEMYRVMMEEEMDVMDGEPVDEEEVASMVDHYLDEVDENNDGYIDYTEYRAKSHFFVS